MFIALWGFKLNLAISVGIDCKAGGFYLHENSTLSESISFCGERFPWSMISRTNVLELQLSGVPWNHPGDHIRIEYQTQGKQLL